MKEKSLIFDDCKGRLSFAFAYFNEFRRFLCVLLKITQNCFRLGLGQNGGRCVLWLFIRNSLLWLDFILWQWTLLLNFGNFLFSPTGLPGLEQLLVRHTLLDLFLVLPRILRLKTPNILIIILSSNLLLLALFQVLAFLHHRSIPLLRLVPRLIWLIGRNIYCMLSYRM